MQYAVIWKFLFVICYCCLLIVSVSNNFRLSRYLEFENIVSLLIRNQIRILFFLLFFPSILITFQQFSYYLLISMINMSWFISILPEITFNLWSINRNCFTFNIKKGRPFGFLFLRLLFLLTVAGKIICFSLKLKIK